MLDRFGALLVERGGEADTTINELLLEAGQGLLSHRGTDEADLAARLGAAGTFRRQPAPGAAPDGEDEEQDPNDRPRGHAGDEEFTDDPALLLAEWEALPSDEGLCLSAANAVSAPEILGALLHVAVGSDDARRVDRIFAFAASALARDPRPGTDVLRQYVRSLGHRADAAESHGLERLVGFARRIGRADVLRSEGVLGPESVEAWFPRYFAAYLDALDPDFASDRDELRRVLARLAGPAFDDAARDLCAEAAPLGQAPVERWLGEGDVGLLPLARLALLAGGPALKERAVEFLRRSLANRREAIGLLLDAEGARLAPDHLLALASPEADGSYPDRVREQAVALACAFVARTRGRKDLAERRARAIRQTAALAPAQAERMARGVLRDRRLGLLPAEPRVVREAARSALASVGRREGSVHV
jgi:hypothetical protein